MSWDIKCSDPECKLTVWPANIAELLDNHRNDDGYFLCGCGRRGSIKKEYRLQEIGEKWEPYLRGAIRLGSEKTYHPFVFLVSYGENEDVCDLWFSYYKDLRSSGGRLKLGYGPGGPPVLGRPQLTELLSLIAKLNLADIESKAEPKELRT